MTPPADIQVIAGRERQPSKRQLVAAIKRLHTTAQMMRNAYANDVAQGRAEAMARLAEEVDAIAQPIINAFPPDYGSRS